MAQRIAGHWRYIPFLVVALLPTVIPLPVSAHDRRAVAGGKYQVVVGFLNEPAIEGQMNGLDLTITDPGSGGAPVEGLDKTLKAEVIVGGNRATRAIALAPRFGMPGKYAAYFVPTQPGAYTFHIYGTIREDRIDERFESGPGRFNDVEPLANLQFPDAAAGPAQLQAQMDATQSRANAALALGVLGLCVGTLGFGSALLVLLRRPTARRDRASDMGQ